MALIIGFPNSYHLTIPCYHVPASPLLFDVAVKRDIPVVGISGAGRLRNLGAPE